MKIRVIESPTGYWEIQKKVFWWWEFLHFRVSREEAIKQAQVCANPEIIYKSWEK